VSIYDKLTTEELESHLSNFLISHWSVSSVNQFARNEKVFEMKYLYGMVQKMPVSSVVGRAYHTAIEYYFKKLKEGKTVGLADLEILAFNEIEETPANEWLLQKTTPTVESCIKEATKNAAIFLRHFYAERGIIEDEIQEIIDVENSGEAFLTVSGVDIPLPCKYRIDLIIKDKKGNIGIIDHKSKRNISSETDVILSSGVQAITYTLAAEKTRNIKVDYVLFIENKLSVNKDGSPQLIRFKMGMDENSRKLYELQLYEPLKRMIEAVNDPDYVYLVNPNDNFVSKPE